MTYSTGVESSPAVTEPPRKLLPPALLAAGVRLLLGTGLAAFATLSPEAHLLVITDLPTLALYGILSLVKIELPISGAFDLRFLFAGIVTWFCGGLLLALLLGRVRSR